MSSCEDIKAELYKLLRGALRAAEAAPRGTQEIRRLMRKRKLTAAQARKYARVRAEIADELPELVARHRERDAAREHLMALLEELKAAREEQGLSLTDLTALTGMDRSALSKLETGQRGNPTLETLVRYAEAVGKKLVVKLANGPRV